MKKTRVVRRITFGVLMFLFCFCCGILSYAKTFEELDSGTYSLDASLSCYINAMGGVEFGKPLLKSAVLTVEEDGSKSITMNLGKSVVNIYSVTCDTFIDPAPAGAVTEGSAAAGTIGYYDAGGALVTSGVHYGMSSDTAMNSKQEQVPYVTSITFPVEWESSSYALSLYVNSNVMGTQFSNEKYPAKLSVNWESVYAQEHAAETSHAAAETEAAPLTQTEAAKAETETLTETQEAVQQKLQKESQKELQKETQQETTASYIKEMDGLNLYQAEKKEEQETTAVNEVVSMDKADGYIAYFDRTVLAIAATAATMLILIGIILIILGGREVKKHEVEKND